MDVTFSVPDHAACIEAILDGFIQCGALLIGAGAVGKPTTAFRLEDDEEERFQLPTESERRGVGDCEDIVIWWASWLRATGRDPKATARIQAVGPKRVHCLLKLGNGKLVDVYQQHLAAQERERFELAGFWSTIKRGVSSVGRGISSAAGSVYHGVGDAASAVGRGVSSAAGAVGDAAGSVYRNVGDAASAVGRGVSNAASSVYYGIGDAALAAGRVPGQIVRGVGGVIGDIGGAIRDAGGAAAGAIGDVASGAADFATAVIEAPTRATLGVLENVGRDVGEALGIGQGGGGGDDGGGGQLALPPGDYGYGGDGYDEGDDDPRAADRAAYAADYDRDPWDDYDQAVS